jgi:hypothetical protein
MKNIFLLCLVLLLHPLVEAKIDRSTAVKYAFIRANPCPASKPHTKYSCPGFVVDHIKALACGGSDAVGNMQWQTLAAGKAKDKWERIGCSPVL